MKLADIVGGSVTIHRDMLIIPAFKELWESDKEDKKYATKIISYIVLNNKWDSPYVQSMDADSRESKLKERFFDNSDYTLTPEEQMCEDEYKSFLNTRALQMLNNMRLKLDSISNYYKESLDDTLDEKKIKDLLAGMTSVGKVMESINSLEDMVKSEEVSMGRVKGDAKVNPYELVK